MLLNAPLSADPARRAQYFRAGILTRGEDQGRERGSPQFISPPRESLLILASAGFLLGRLAMGEGSPARETFIAQGHDADSLTHQLGEHMDA